MEHHFPHSFTCQIPHLNNSKDLPVHEKCQFWLTLFIWPVIFITSIGIYSYWEGKTSGMLYSCKGNLKNLWKKSSEETSIKHFTKSIFVPVDGETELYADLSIYSCLPASQEAKDRMHRYWIRSYKLTSIKHYIFLLRTFLPKWS